MKWKVTEENEQPRVTHDCRRVGMIEAVDDWNFCAYCGNEVPPTIKKQIKAIQERPAPEIEKNHIPEAIGAAALAAFNQTVRAEQAPELPGADEIEARRTAIREMDAHVTTPNVTAPEGYEIETGGQGCYSYRKDLPGGRFVLLTDEEGADLPEEGKPTLVGFYPPDFDDDPRTERACFRTLPTLKAALAFVRRSEDTYNGRG